MRKIGRKWRREDEKVSENRGRSGQRKKERTG